jgi:hypothetical protein
MLVQHVLHAMDTQTFAFGAGKQDLPVATLSLTQPGGQDSLRRLGHWCTALLAAFADDVHVRPCSEDEVLALETGHLGKPQAGLHRQHEGVIALPGPCMPIRSK